MKWLFAVFAAMTCAVMNAEGLLITAPVQISGPRFGTDIESGRAGLAASKDGILMVWRSGDAVITDRDGRRRLAFDLGAHEMATTYYKDPPAAASDGRDFLVVYPTVTETGEAMEAKHIDARGGVREIGIISEHYQSDIDWFQVKWTGASYLVVYATGTSVRMSAIAADGSVLRQDQTVADVRADAAAVACDRQSCRLAYSHANTIDILRVDLNGVIIRREASVAGFFPAMTWDGNRYLMSFMRGGTIVIAEVNDAGVFDLQILAKTGDPFTALASDEAGTTFFIWDDYVAPRFAITRVHYATIESNRITELDAAVRSSAPVKPIWDGQRFLVSDPGIVRAFARDGSKDLLFSSPRPLGPPCRFGASSATIARTTLVTYSECESWFDDGTGRLHYTPAANRATLLSPFEPDREVVLGVGAAVGSTIAADDTFLVAGATSAGAITATRLSATGERLDADPLVLGTLTSSVFKPKAVWNGSMFVVAWEHHQVLIPEAGAPRAIADDPNQLGVLGIASNGTSHLLAVLENGGTYARIYAPDGRVLSDAPIGPPAMDSPAASNGDEYVVFRSGGDVIEAWRLDRTGTLLGRQEIVRASNFERTAAWDGFHYLLVWADPVQVIVEKLTSGLDRVGDVQRFVEGTFRTELWLSAEKPGVTRFLSRCNTTCSQLAMEQQPRSRGVRH